MKTHNHAFEYDPNDPIIEGISEQWICKHCKLKVLTYNGETKIKVKIPCNQDNRKLTITI